MFILRIFSLGLAVSDRLLMLGRVALRKQNRLTLVRWLLL